jgi:membrane associated rhomboid family serine protease
LVFQFITAVIHAMTLFMKPPPTNDTEKQLFALMDTYKFDFGAGFHRTMGELTLALSACFCLVCLLGGLLNWYLLRKKVEPEIMKGVITINLIVFGICFGLMATFTFLPPVVLTSLIFLFLILSRLAIYRSNK